MLSKILKLIDVLATSYWFIPSLMAIAAFLAASYFTQSEWIMNLQRNLDLVSVFSFQAEGARTVMATVAGSMITVAGVTFSITIASIVHATNQFGPRLLTNFMNDRGNQVTLGIFIATFLYCLIVLSTIPGYTEVESFTIPSLAVLIGVGMAIASVCVLIYFVHHVPASIHASNVIASIGKQLVDKAEMTYRESGETERGEHTVNQLETLISGAGSCLHIRATFTGYVQFLDLDALTVLATDRDVLLVLNVKPGDFVNAGSFIACVYGAAEDSDPLTEQVCAAFLYGDQRTPAQDLLFLANELVEIATRALSPGITDPFTAMMCMDWLGSSFSVVAGRYPEPELRYDRLGELRMVVPMLSASEYVSGTMGKLLPYICEDRNAAFHAQAMLGKLMITSGCPVLLPVFGQLALELSNRAQARMEASDIELLNQRHAVITAISTDRSDNTTLYNENRWLCRGV